MIVGTAVPTIIVGTNVPTMVAGTKVSFVVVPTSPVGTAVTMIIVGTKISLMIVPITFIRPVGPTNVVRTTIHINSLKTGQYNFKVFLGGHEKKKNIRGDMATFTDTEC